MNGERSRTAVWVSVALLLAITGASTEPGRLPTAAPLIFQQTRETGWEPCGFGGAGNFLSVHFHPNQAGVVYAASDVAGVFRSIDYGDHWEMRSVGLGNYEVSSFAVDPFNGNTVYAGTGAFTSSNKAGIYLSHDAGLAWEHLTSTFTHHITFRKYRTSNAIAPDPAQQGVILSGSRDNGIWRSMDEGHTWSQVYSAPLTTAPLFNDGTISDDVATDPHPAPVSIVVFDPVVSNMVYAGLDGAGVIKSTQGGVAGSWEAINSGLPPSATVKYLAIGSGGVIYAAVAEEGIYKTIDGGNTWRSASGSLPPLNVDTWISSVAVHPTDSNIAYLTLVTYDYPNIWKTTDGGATWVPRGDVAYDPVNDPTEVWATNPTWSWQVTLDRAKPDRLFFVSYWDIYRSDDGGEHWSTKIFGAQNTVVTDLIVDIHHPADQPDVLYATHMDAGLLSSTDKGVTWTVFPRTYDTALSGHYWRFAIAQVGDRKYYYTTSDPWSQNYGQVLRSTDGVNWMKVFSQTRPKGEFMDGAMLGLAVDPNEPSTVYLAQDGGHVWKSTNDGNTWALTTGQPLGSSFTYALAVDTAGRVFAGTLRDGLWRTTNGGASWERVLNGQDTIFGLLTVPGAVYASSGDGNLFQSSDGGITWNRLTDFRSVDDDGVGDQGMAIAVNPNDPNHLLFSRTDTWHSADSGPGVVESTDGGASWTPLNNDLRHSKVSALALGQDGTIFAGTWGGGIWRLGTEARPVTTTVRPPETTTTTQPPPSRTTATSSITTGTQPTPTGLPNELLIAAVVVITLLGAGYAYTRRKKTAKRHR